MNMSSAMLLAILTACAGSCSAADHPSSQAPAQSVQSTVQSSRRAATNDPASGASSDPAVDEVLANLRSQSAGSHTVADYHLPEAFLRGLADRIILAAFEDQFRVVIDDGTARSHDANRHNEHNAAPSAPTPAPTLQIMQRELPEAVERYRRDLKEMHLPLRGYRAPVLTKMAEFWPTAMPDEQFPHEFQEAAAIVAKRLTVDGLLLATARAIETLGPEQFMHDAEQALDQLQLVGVPTDLLEYFSISRSNAAQPQQHIVMWIAARLMEGKSADELGPTLEKAHFSFQPSLPGFRVAPESGQRQIDSIRLQLTRGSDWIGTGDGGNIDLTRQLLHALPNAKFIASIQRQHAARFAQTVAQWMIDRPAEFTLICEELPVAQWAQDNVKLGHVSSADAAADYAKPALLLPRFASRGEDRSIFIPGETFAPEAMIDTGHAAAQSPLLFQGGNLLAVQHPATGERILLIGEAEIHRNTTLGLTREQILNAFRIEFGVDRCEVIPAVSFHIDYDFCVRAHHNKLIAFVNDTSAACAIVLNAAIDRMHDAGFISEADAKTAQQQIQTGQWREFLRWFGPHLFSHADADGRFPLSFAEKFSVSHVDSGVGNLQRVLLALDMTAARTFSDDEAAGNPALETYWRALRRREESRRALHAHLEKLGFDVAPVPSLADASRSINTVNGIHARGVYLMPAYGGMFAELDQAALRTYQQHLGDEIKIIPILTGESQRRAGALHCSIAVRYSPE